MGGIALLLLMTLLTFVNCDDTDEDRHGRRNCLIARCILVALLCLTAGALIHGMGEKL
jgi:hypothetical protein